MGFLDKAKKIMERHDDKVDQAIDKGGELLDRRTGEKYTEPIDQATEAAKKHTGEADTTR